MNLNRYFLFMITLVLLCISFSLSNTQSIRLDEYADYFYNMSIASGNEMDKHIIPCKYHKGKVMMESADGMINETLVLFPDESTWPLVGFQKLQEVDKKHKEDYINPLKSAGYFEKFFNMTYNELIEIVKDQNPGFNITLNNSSVQNVMVNIQNLTDYQGLNVTHVDETKDLTRESESSETDIVDVVQCYNLCLDVENEFGLHGKLFVRKEGSDDFFRQYDPKYSAYSEGSIGLNLEKRLIRYIKKASQCFDKGLRLRNGKFSRRLPERMENELSDMLDFIRDNKGITDAENVKDFLRYNDFLLSMDYEEKELVIDEDYV